MEKFEKLKILLFSIIVAWGFHSIVGRFQMPNQFVIIELALVSIFIEATYTHNWKDSKATVLLELLFDILAGLGARVVYPILLSFPLLGTNFFAKIGEVNFMFVIVAIVALYLNINGK